VVRNVGSKASSEDWTSTQGEGAVLQRLKLLRRLQEVTRSPDEAWALLERVKANTSSADDREQ
jgi:hypothetical protein